MKYLLLAAWAAVAAEWPDITPAQRDWFLHQHNQNGFLCCDIADGHPTDWRIADGHYLVLVGEDWHEVPSEAVIKVPNPVGRAVVWYRAYNPSIDGPKRDRTLTIRCFIPGSEV